MSTARLRDLYLKQEPRLAQLRYPTSLSWMSACLSCPSRRDAWWPHPANLQARHLSKQSGRDVKAGGVTGHTLTKWRCCTTFCLADFTDKLRSSFPGCQPDLGKLSRRVRTASLTVTVYPPRWCASFPVFSALEHLESDHLPTPEHSKSHHGGPHTIWLNIWKL